MQQQVVAEQVRSSRSRKRQQIKVQEAEIPRREKELIATVLKQAEIERQRIETLAEAETQRLIAEAEGHAEAIRTQGEAEAEIIFKKGEAEAKAMNVRPRRTRSGTRPLCSTSCSPAAGGGARDGRAARQGRQDHDRLDRRRRRRRHEQDHRRHGQDGRAGAGAVRDALRHADVGSARQGPDHRRQDEKKTPATPRASCHDSEAGES